MKVIAKFDEIPSMILEVIKETKRYGHTFGPTQTGCTAIEDGCGLEISGLESRGTALSM